MAARRLRILPLPGINASQQIFMINHHTNRQLRMPDKYGKIYFFVLSHQRFSDILLQRGIAIPHCEAAALRGVSSLNLAAFRERPFF
jgi:hypothetical protein